MEPGDTNRLILAGTHWVLIGFKTDAGMIPAAVQAPATIEFAEGDGPTGQINGSGGCNRYFASYTLTGDRLTLGPMGSTFMMCDDERMAQEDRFFQALQAAERVELRGGQLWITYPAGVLRFARAAAPP